MSQVLVVTIALTDGDRERKGDNGYSQSWKIIIKVDSPFPLHDKDYLNCNIVTRFQTEIYDNQSNFVEDNNLVLTEAVTPLASNGCK